MPLVSCTKWIHSYARTLGVVVHIKYPRRAEGSPSTLRFANASISFDNVQAYYLHTSLPRRRTLNLRKRGSRNYYEGYWHYGDNGTLPGYQMFPCLLTTHARPFCLTQRSTILLDTISRRGNERATITMKIFGQSFIRLALLAAQLSPLAQGALAPQQSAHRKRSFLNPATESKLYPKRRHP